jgi:hypothetical protein
MLLLQRGQYQKLPLPPVSFHRPSALWAIGRSPHMFNSEGQVAWRKVSRDPSGLILRECVQHMRIGEQTGQTASSLLERHRLMTGRRSFPSWASNHCKRCKSEPQIAADVIFKITSRRLTTTRSAFVNEHIFFFLTPKQAFIIQASRPFGFVRDCKDLVQESCRCAKTKRGSKR